MMGRITGADAGVQLSRTPSGDLIVGGTITRAGNTQVAAWRIAPDNSVRWVSDHVSSSGALTKRMAIHSDGQIFLAGEVEISAGNTDFLTVCFGPNGEERWFNTFDGDASGIDALNGLIVDASGNAYVSGKVVTRVAPTIQEDIATLKYDAAGVQVWSHLFDGPESLADAGGFLGLDAEGVLYVGGTQEASITEEDALVYQLNSDQAGLAEARYMPEMLSVADYYPFGMLMPGRNESSDQYRYGFQGKEREERNARWWQCL